MGGIGALVHQDGAVPEPVTLLVEALAYDRVSTNSVKDLCKKLTGSSGSIKHLYMVCECKKGTWFLAKSLFVE